MRDFVIQDESIHSIPKLINLYGIESPGLTSSLAIAKYVNLAKKHNILPSTFANAFVNDRPFVTSNIIGATTVEQLKENIDSINITLSKEILEEIEDIHLSDPNPCV